MTIIFKDPPKATRTPHQETLRILAALKSRPGEWALIKADVSAAMATIWNKRVGIEAKSSSVGKAKGKFDVYARWVGEKK